MKFVCISDTHTRSIPDILGSVIGDVLLIAGDWSSTGSFKNIDQFKEYLKQVRPNFKEIVWVNGNHEILLERYSYLSPEIAKETNTIYLEDSSVTVDGIKIFGSPWTPEFFDWAYMYKRGTDRWNVIPDDTDILITHGPPYKIGDLTQGYRGNPPEHVGCYDLAQRVREVKPKVHIFGHIHCAYGEHQDPKNPDTRYLNVAVCDEDYFPSNSPTVFEI